MAEQKDVVETDVEMDVATLDPEEVADADIGDFGIVEEAADDAERPDIKTDDAPDEDAGDSEEAEETAETETESVPDAEVDKQPKKQEWDKDRQVKDQELAGLRKQNAQLTEALVMKGKGEGESETADDTLDLDSELPELEEFADEDARVERINLLTRRDKARNARDAQKANKDAYDAILVECDDKFGPEFRNEAVAKMKEIWEKEGFGPGNYPDAASTKLAVRGVYAELQNTQLREGPKKPTKKKTSSPKPDTGRGGKVARKAAAGMMTMDEAVADMDASGELEWAKEK